MPDSTSRRVRRPGCVLFAVYLLLVFLTRRPLQALALEMAAVAGLWVLYVARFAFTAPRALAPEMLRFRAGDRLVPAPGGVVVFTGSSTIAHWTSLAEDMAPIPVVGRGISGARLSQIATLTDRLVLVHHPRAVVLYAGENDLAGFLGLGTRSPEQVLDSFRSFVEHIHARQPEVPVYFISIKPPKRRVAMKGVFDQANSLVRAHCASDPRLHFIDVGPALVGADGRPLPGIFDFDGIHLNRAGYRILTSVVRPFLDPR